MDSRRKFLKAALAVPAVLLMSSVGFAQQKKKKKGEGADEIGWAVEGKGAAATIKYYEDKKRVPKAEQITKAGIPFEKQDCANCILFQNGICTIITDNNKKVKPEGWCPTWTLNPAVKS